MAALKMLKPRIATLDTRRLKTLDTTSWGSDRGSAARGYGYKWQKARERYLMDHPLCCYCQRDGIITAASVVDHIVPHKGDASLFWNEANWQPLCKPCHDSVKAKEEGRGGSKV